MENRRGGEPGRRDEDRRWLDVQKQLMNLVTTQRTNQNELAKLEITVGKLADHVEDVDDHLRGVAGKESLDTRVTLLEKEFEMHGVLLRRISDQFGSLHQVMDEIKSDVSTLKITKAITDRVDLGRMERFKEWLKFWGPIILATIALVVPLAKLAFEHWDRIAPYLRAPRQTAEALRQEIEQERKGPRGRAVRKKEADIERSAKEMQ